MAHKPAQSAPSLRPDISNSPDAVARSRGSVRHHQHRYRQLVQQRRDGLSERQVREKAVSVRPQHEHVEPLLVRHVRLVIIASSTLAIAAVGYIALFDPFKRLPHDVSVGNVGMHGSEVTMTAPKMSGMRPNGQPFELKGVTGSQDILRPNVVKLFGVDAKIGMDDTSTSKITARSGIYDSSRDMIWLKGSVHIVNDSGYDMRMPSAFVDIKTSALMTRDPVVMLLNGGRVLANTMNIENDGHKITFDGDVRSVVDSNISVDAEDGTDQPEASK